MPKVTSFLKTSKKHSEKQQTQLLTPDRYPTEKSPRVTNFWRPHKGKNSFLLTGSQSRILRGSSTSISTPATSYSTRQMPKCKTVANFDNTTTTTTSSNLAAKCSSVASFGPLRRGGSSLCASLASLGLSRAASMVGVALGKQKSNRSLTSITTNLELCRLCLCDMPPSQMIQLTHCGCKYCHYCLQQYVRFEVTVGNVTVTCPDASCEKKGILSVDEISSLLDEHLFDKFNRYKLNYEVDMDPSRVWCPQPGCDTICSVPLVESPCSVICLTCQSNFCSRCKFKWHQNESCDANARKKSKLQSCDEGLYICEDEDSSIKRCPLCRMPIERDEGCAQMMCKRCKHVFCWYCLASLDDDFLLRHYDKGPCKNKLGHSKASVFWHRTQVVGILAGFGLLLLVASPFLLLVAPCILCSNCSGGCKNSCHKDEDSVAATNI